MWKTILEVGSVFDWISPLGGLIGDLVNGPSHTFLIPVECGYSGREISRLLKRRGVDSWGHMVVQGTIMISVRQSQVGWAQHLLDQAGIPTFAEPGTEPQVGSPQAVNKPESKGESGSLGETLKEIGDFRIF